MKLKDFINELSFFLNNKGENLEVVVPIQGIGGPYTKVTGASQGFDWYDGKLMVNTEDSLSTVSLRQYSDLSVLYLKKVSNYNKVNSGETLIAKYKTKTFKGDSKYQCLIWLREMLDKELDKR